MNKRLALVTDAWHPQVNGVVRTLGHVCDGLRSRGHEVTVISPQDYRSFPCPTYPEIRLAFTTRRKLEKRLRQLPPKALSAFRQGASVCAMDGNSAPVSTPGSPNICASGCRCHCHGPTLSCAAFILPQAHASSQPCRSTISCVTTDLRTRKYGPEVLTGSCSAGYRSPG